MCMCPKCKDMTETPVCGEMNNKEYKNECALRREECLTGRKIGMKEGPCTGLFIPKYRELTFKNKNNFVTSISEIVMGLIENKHTVESL